MENLVEHPQHTVTGDALRVGEVASITADKRVASGTARAWPDGPDDSMEDEDADHVNLRLLHMAEAGKKSVEQSMEMAELLRKMRAPMPDLASRIENLRSEHEWWSGQLRHAEAQIESGRQRAKRPSDA